MLDYEKSHNILIGLNKPRGVICTHNDEKGRVRVYDLIPKNILKDFKKKIHSVGRLDYNSQGLILLTNNTRIKSYLESPSSKILRVYKVKIQGLITNNIIKKYQKGLQVGNIFYSIISMKIIKQSKSYSWLIVKLDEGKNQHIRKIFKRIGFNVNKLIRIQYGTIKLSSLKPGNLKFLSPFKLNLIDL